MIKRLDNVNTYVFTINNRDYIVVIERIMSMPSGNPRFEARIISSYMPGREYLYTVKYRFHGHYYDERSEAEFILIRHLESMKES